ncbi:YncE family protein [Fodinicola feengrottensis]
MEANKTIVSANQLAHTVTAVDVSSRERIATIPTPPEPHMLVFDAQRQLLYVAITYRDGIYDAHGDRSHEIVVIDPKNWAVVRVVDISPYEGPHDLAVVGDQLVVACESHGGCLLLLDLPDFRIWGHIPAGTVGPHWLAITPDGGKAYTGNKEAPFVSAYDLASGTMTGKLPMLGGSEDLEAVGDRLYVSDRSEKLLRVFDTSTDNLISQVPLPRRPHRVHVLPNGHVVTSHFGDSWDFEHPDPGSVSIIDPDAGTVLQNIGAGAGPLGITSDEGILYVNNAMDATTTVIDTRTYEVTGTIEMDAGAHEIVVI